jgi:hypothetical protein
MISTAPSNPFVRVWPDGGLSKLLPFDRRAWPWWCAYALTAVLRMPPGASNRDRVLEWAGNMATARSPMYRRGPVGGGQYQMLAWALTRCDLCGKPGLYISGCAGRCSDHRDRVDPYRVKALRLAECERTRDAESFRWTCAENKRRAHSRSFERQCRRRTQR